MKFLLVGGGTGGPTTTLLALVSEIKKHHAHPKFLFVSDASEPTVSLVKRARIPLATLSSGKWRRYLSLRNITDIFRTLHAVQRAKKILADFQPDIIITAGSFIAVPVALAKKRHIPLFVHQQDAKPGLANRILLRFANRVTTALEHTLCYLPTHKAVWTGNPVREEILTGNAEKARKWLKLEKDLPCVLVLGGGTGSQAMNRIMVQAGPHITRFAQIVHITGKGKDTDWQHPRYHKKEFIYNELADALAAADIVISRAGMATTTELAAMKKPTIMIPLPNTHQEDNADIFEEHEAVIELDQEEIDQEDIVTEIKALLQNPKKSKKMGENLFALLKPLEAQKKIEHEIAEVLRQSIKGRDVPTQNGKSV